MKTHSLLCSHKSHKAFKMTGEALDLVKVHLENTTIHGNSDLNDVIESQC